MAGRASQLWLVFRRKAKRIGYELAVAWLMGPTCPFPEAMRTATLERAIRENLASISVGQATLTRNRRRKGYFG